MQQVLRSGLVWALAVATGACATAPGSGGDAVAGAIADASSAQAATPDADVDRLLTYSRIESIVSARGPAFTRRVALLAGDLTDEELERLVPAVDVGFSPNSLRDDVARFLAAEDGFGFVQEVLAWHEGGANAELKRVADAYDPPLSVEEFARALTSDPPDRERVRLMVDWAEAQGAGGFFVLMDEALAQAAHAVWAEFRPEAASFEPMAGDELFSRLDASMTAAVVQFMHRYETVPAAVLRAATDEYLTDAGLWYVETYSLAVAEAIRSAGRRVVEELRRSEP